MSAPLAFLVTHHDVQNSFTLVLHVKLNMKHLYVVMFKHIVYFPFHCHEHISRLSIMSPKWDRWTFLCPCVKTGYIYRNDCPGAPYIPIYMMVMGASIMLSMTGVSLLLSCDRERSYTCIYFLFISYIAGKGLCFRCIFLLLDWVRLTISPLVLNLCAKLSQPAAGTSFILNRSIWHWYRSSRLSLCKRTFKHISQNAKLSLKSQDM